MGFSYLGSNIKLFLIQEEAVHICSTFMYTTRFWDLLKIQTIHRKSETHVFLWGLLVSEIEEEDAGQGANQEDDVEPSVVEVEL